MIYSKTLTAKRDVGFINVGEAVRSDTITFNITNLTLGNTFQWFVKANTNDADINAIAGDTGTVNQSSEAITFTLPTIDFTVGTTYYFALREFNGSSSQEVIQVAFTIAQNAVLGQGTSKLNISPLFLPNLTTVQRDAYPVSDNALLIYNTDDEQIQYYDPATSSWSVLSAGGLFLQANNNLSDLNNITTARTNLGLGGLVGFKTFTVGSTADCDYVYNNVDLSVALNAAITALPSRGGIIKIQAGTYAILNSINARNKANLQIIGAGIEHTNLLASGLTTAFFNMYSNVEVNSSYYRYKYLLRGLTLNNTTPSAGSRGIYVGALSDSSFQDIVLKNFEQGLSLNAGMFYNNFHNIKFENCKSDVVMNKGAIDSIGTIDKPNSNSFIGCKLLADTSQINGSLGQHECVTINEGNQNSFIACQFENFTRAIYVNDIGNTFISNRIESNDVTGSVNYVTTTVDGENNTFSFNYYSGNDYIDFTTSISNLGAGNSFWEGNTFKGQTITFERNIITAGDVALFKRTGSGDGKSVIIAEDTYTPSGSPLNFLAKAVRASAKLYSGTLNGTENFYVTAQGGAYFANGVDVNSKAITNVLDPTALQHAATKNYVDNPFAWSAASYGYLSWMYDHAVVNNQTIITAGTLYVNRLIIPRAVTVSNIHVRIGTAGSTLTNSYVALYDDNTLLTQSSNQSSNWTSTGEKTISITPQNIPAGTRLNVVFWVGSATTAPGFARSGSQGGANGNLTGSNLRWSTADTGITTTAPGTLGSRTTSNNTFWVAIS